MNILARGSLQNIMYRTFGGPLSLAKRLKQNAATAITTMPIVAFATVLQIFRSRYRFHSKWIPKPTA